MIEEVGTFSLEEASWSIKTTDLYGEPCNCGSHIRHNNGGNYHRITRLHTSVCNDGENSVVVLEQTTTRERFPRDELEVLVFNASGPDPKFEIVPQEWIEDEPDCEVLQTFLWGEARILFSVVCGEEQTP